MYKCIVIVINIIDIVHFFMAEAGVGAPIYPYWDRFDISICRADQTFVVLITHSFVVVIDCLFQESIAQRL